MVKDNQVGINWCCNCRVSYIWIQKLPSRGKIWNKQPSIFHFFLFCCYSSIHENSTVLSSTTTYVAHRRTAYLPRTIRYLELPHFSSSRFCGMEQLTCCLLELQQGFYGGRGRLWFPSGHLLVDDSGAGRNCHFLLGPILLPGGQHVHYRLRFWGRMELWWDWLFGENLSGAAESCWWKKDDHPENCPVSHLHLSSQTPPSLTHPGLLCGPARYQRHGSPAAASPWPAVGSVHSPLLSGRRASAWWEPGKRAVKHVRSHINVANVLIHVHHNALINT